MLLNYFSLIKLCGFLLVGLRLSAATAKLCELSKRYSDPAAFPCNIKTTVIYQLMDL